MALEHAILISLRERAGSGYELAQRFGRSMAYFWPATHQQIYRTLGRMAEQGWVSVTEVPQEGRPDKKTYAVTAAGRAELRRWSAEPAPRAALRDDLVVKVRGAAYADIEAIIAQAQERREASAEQLERYREIERRDFPGAPGLTGQALHQWLVLRAGIRLEENEIEWCDELITALRRDLGVDE
ncbi:PadR family transcriptional regulator [Actinomycetota bacterium]